MKHAFYPLPQAAQPSCHGLQPHAPDVRTCPPEHRRPEWVSLRYVAALTEPLLPFLQALHIRGLRPQWLETLRVHDAQGAVFELESLADPIGRRVSAGEIAQAICAQAAPDQITVCSTQFVRALPVTQAMIELQVRMADGQTTHTIQVHGELA